jgi:hypothetical protein
MPDPQAVRSLVDLGGLVLFVSLVLAIGWGAIKKDPWWVPGFVYKREVDRADKSDAQADRNTKALEKLAGTAKPDPVTDDAGGS